MLDMKWIRDNPEAFDLALEKRGKDASAQRLIDMDEARRSHISKLQQVQSRRNEASKEIGKAKAAGDEERAQALITEIAEAKSFLQSAEEEERRLSEALETELMSLPNIPLEGIPVGTDENDNVEMHQWGEVPKFNFEPKEHFDIGEALGGMDFEMAGKLSGSRFAVLKGQLAALERALGQYMINFHTGVHGYEEVSPPLLVRDSALYGTSQLPKFAEDQFRTTDGLWLIPTAEVPLTNLAREQIAEEKMLPQRYSALTYCFRSEAGSAGRDVRGMLRQHQFLKCELVSITKPDDSLKELERMRDCAEKVLQGLGLHYRVVTLCTGDMGFGARKTYDIEVWLPGQKMYREISSCSVCGDFQARRMNARYRDENGKPRFVHTLNGSGVAVGRALIAVLENYQHQDGTVTVPEVLRPLMGGLEVIGE
ncbi:MAG: serine--tRNA ligase [Stappiaceae bacterium]